MKIGRSISVLSPRLLSHFSCSVIVAGMLAATHATASTEAHVHSVAKLNIAQDGRDLLLEFDSPLANLTGFEYKPRNMAEHVKLNQAIIKLKTTARQFRFSGWKCDLQDLKVIRPWLEEEPAHDEHDVESVHDEHDDEHAHDEHDDEHAHDEHDDEHAHDEHDDEHAHDEKHVHDEHQESDEHENHESHSDLQVHYHFACRDLDNKQGLTVLLFNDFPQIEEIQVAWLTDKGTGSAELTATQNKLDLSLK